ncbi:hypothetical protein B0H16DRAFT_1893426 [Mycena metata]|uniref:DUF6589 domain-containing protein n=1 Tax=Mycena metata TaxID=1033252 RepID=A0AAD7HZN5_9AGAR|nr:hypothetical protein B0H16DRAFT_1893426 [Mycena metata]
MGHYGPLRGKSGFADAPRRYNKQKHKQLALTVPVLPPVPPNADQYRVAGFLPTVPLLSAPPLDPVEPRICAPKRTLEERATADVAAKFDAMERILGDLHPFSSLGEFLSFLFYHRPHGESDPRGLTHAKVVSRFLSGRSSICMADILPLIYQHRSSFPSVNSTRSHERNAMFCTSGRPEDLQHARPYLLTWAAHLTAEEARRQVEAGTHDDPDDPNNLGHFSIRRIEEQYLKILPLPMMLTEFMAAPRVKGVFTVCKRRPHPMIQVSAIASFIVSRNRYANGDLAMILGIWHFACKSHVDLKRVYCRLASTVSDTTSRDALVSVTAANFTALQLKTRAATAHGERITATIFDNVQEYCPVYEQGIGRQSEMKVGCAATCVGLEDCAPGAFTAKPYYDRVALNLRTKLTTDILYDNIDWDHVGGVIQLHWLSALAEFAPELEHLLPLISNLFRTTFAKHPMREGRKTPVQPLSTNSEHELTSQGLERAIYDFDGQIGIEREIDDGLLEILQGDGASYAMLLRLSKFCAPLGKFRNKIPLLEIWHNGSTTQNSIAANHYGPATSSDPSSLCKCSSTAGFKRPANVKCCDYYPTVRNCTAIWKAHVLDCWRRSGGSHLYPCQTNQLPTLDTLLANAATLVDRYASLAAPQHALDAAESTNPDHINPVPVGSPWVPLRTPATQSPPVQNAPPPVQMDAADTMPDLVDIQEPSDVPHTAAPETEAAPKCHEELPGFTGDRVLRNSELFMMDFGWFLELITAVPEGDIGRVWEIMKIWIFTYAGSSHEQYRAYLLELYCFLKYDASVDLRDAVLNNWLVNITGELGKWIPGDLLQEHYNRWLEDMVQKHGAEFDDEFYRKMISPNVHYFLRIKEEITEGFNLKSRGKTHTSRDVRDEVKLLMALFKEEEVHLFREGRSMGHAAVNQFARGCRCLDEGKLNDFLEKSTPPSTPTASADEDEQMRPHSSPSPPCSPSPAPSVSSAREDEPMQTGSASPRSLSPASSTLTSDCGSECSTWSIASVASTVDPNEPEDDGDDRTHCKLASGSFGSFYINARTGLMEYAENGEGEVEEEGEDDGRNEDEQEDDKSEVENIYSQSDGEASGSESN